ncbi:helix-turn-helix domain-containing protein [Desulfocurvibacter africanus]|uniref:helix-turn-helix domain-containing protein n=1 Tax=Desulfocurvibacter africanus TaxID=873 RepID=UPI000481B175|nr:helix-turn-helix domain-containing protein [Desulfocurvibacter africanus]
MPKAPRPSISVLRSLRKLGQDMRDARLRRRLPMAVVAERADITRQTLAKIEKGDASVSMGNYAAVLFALGLGTPLGDLADARNDEIGLRLEEERLPKRVRLPRRKEDRHE